MVVNHIGKNACADSNGVPIGYVKERRAQVVAKNTAAPQTGGKTVLFAGHKRGKTSSDSREKKSQLRGEKKRQANQPKATNDRSVCAPLELVRNLSLQRNDALQGVCTKNQRRKVPGKFKDVS